VLYQTSVLWHVKIMLRANEDVVTSMKTLAQY
jgi:hypothetical protein